MNYRIKRLSSVCYASVMMGLVMASCAEGVDINEQFTQGAGVTNAQLESPELDPASFKTQINADGSESVEVTWPVIFGAGGYLANVKIVTDPENPIEVIKDSVIDGCHFSFPREIDNLYTVSLSTLGNEKLNNTGSLTPTIVEYDSKVDVLNIPEGWEISTFIRNNKPQTNRQTAYALEPGKTYQLSGEANFDLLPVILRGDEENRPLVVISNKGCLVTQAGLRVQNINFDCGASEASSFIKLSDRPSETISSEALGLIDLGATQKNAYIIQSQIAIESCNFRNIPKSIIFANNQPYNLNVFRIDNCIMQLNNASSATFINFYSSSALASSVKTLLITNSTIYNMVENSTAYFIRYANASNSQPPKVFGTGETSTHTIDHCTLDRTFTGKDFANNMVQTNAFGVVLTNNIFYDVFRIYQYIRGSATFTASNNAVFYEIAGSSSNDLKYADEINPDFVGPTIQEFNLDEAKGGVNFRPQESTCVSNKMGDPRWFE